MSLDPHWFSTIFGLLFLIQQALAAMGFVLLLMASMSKTLPMSRIVRASDIHDYGKFLLTFVMVWAYFSFSQFLIIWSANLPEEIPWYLDRMRHGWEWFSILLIVGQFFLPFFLLLSRDLKRTAGRVAIVGGAGPGDALRRLLLERDAGAEPRDADAALDQPGDARRPRRHLGLALRRAVQVLAGAADRRSVSSGGALRAMAHTNNRRRTGERTHVHPGGEVHGHGVRAASAAVHHEVTDIPLGGLTRAAVIAVVFVGLVMVLMWGAWGFFLSQAKQGDPGKPAMAAEDFGQRLPATPRLQSVPGDDLTVLPGRSRPPSSAAWPGSTRAPAPCGCRSTPPCG